MFNFVFSKYVNKFCYLKYFYKIVIENLGSYQLKVLYGIFVSDNLFYKKKFKSVLWMKSEIFDMFDMIFINNWDLKKILSYYTFFGSPSKKNFLLSGYLKLIFCEMKSITFKILVELMQEFSFFLNSFYIYVYSYLCNLSTQRCFWCLKKYLL